VAKTKPTKLGRSLLAGETTVDELRKLTKKFGFAKHYITDELTSYVNDSVIVDGNLTIDGDFDTYANQLCRLVVTGDLKVNGLYQDHDDPQTAVFVLGDFEATNAITAGALGVAGNVYVEEVLVGFYNDHSAEIHGHVTTTALIPENHFFSIKSVLGCDYLLGSRADYVVKPKKKIAPCSDEQARAVLVPEVLEIEDYGDPDETPEININDTEIRKRLRAHLPVLRDLGSKPAANAPTVKSAKPAAAKPAARKAAKKPTAKKPAATKPAMKPAAKKRKR